MATPIEIEQQLQRLNQLLNGLEDAGAISATQFRANNKTYTKVQLQKEINDLEKDISSLTKLVKPYRDAQQKVKSAAALAPGQQLTATQRKILATEQTKLDKVAAKTLALPTFVSALARPVRQGQPITVENPIVTAATRPTGPAATQPTGPAGLQPTGPAAPRPTGATGPTGPRPTVVTGRTSPAKPAKPGETVVLDGKKVKVGSDQWKTIIQQEFGSLWDVYNNNPDLKKVIDQSVKEGYFNDQLKMDAVLQNTGWYRTTSNAARKFAIQMSTNPGEIENQIIQATEELRSSTLASGVTFNDATLRKLATDRIKFGWSAEQERNAVGSEAIAAAELGGAQGIADLRTGTTARGLREKAAAYAQKPSEALIDTWTKEIMTGKKSATNWEDLMRDSARTQFRSLQPALDKGQDVETALYAYKQQATATLGSSVDTSNIDWTSDKWNKALNFRDEKTNEFRQMDLWEWNKYLRTLPEWQNTNEAKDAYRNVAFSLAQGFGKMA
jgi:hypothetical protein